MPLVRVTNFAISLDGYSAGEPQSFEGGARWWVTSDELDKYVDHPVEGLVAEDVPLGVELELALAVHEVDERGAALVAPRDHPPGHAIGAVALLARLEVVHDG